MAKSKNSKSKKPGGVHGNGKKKKNVYELQLRPDAVKQGDIIYVEGRGFGGCPFHLLLDEKIVRPARITSGRLSGNEIISDPMGGFIAELPTYNLSKGKHVVSIAGADEHVVIKSAASFLIMERPGPEVAIRRKEQEARKKKDDKERNDEEGWDPPYWRELDFFKRRFGHLGYIPDGVREQQISELRKIRGRQMKDAAGTDNAEPSQPVPGSCNWTPVGPSAVVVNATTAYSGRAISIAFHPTDPLTIYVGTANGGVWKTVDGGQRWSPKSDYQRSLAIGALAIDPNDPQRIFAGTGQYGSAVGTFYGNGILRTIDGGNSWTELATATFLRDEISKLLFDPTDGTSQRMFLSSRTGVYSSVDGGNNWTVMRAGAASDLVLIPTGNNVQLIAGFAGSGIWTASRTGGSWSSWTQYVSAAIPTVGFDRIVLGQCSGSDQNIYAAFSNGGSIEAMAKTNNGGNNWNVVVPPISSTVSKDSSSGGAPLHTHNVVISAAQLSAGAAAVVTTGPPSAGAAHTHTISVTAAQMQLVASGLGRVIITTDADATGHTHGFVLDRRVSGQTWYNFHISPHPSDPNTVYYGEVGLWKTTTGDGPWTSLPILHTDNHAFGYEPSNATNVWSVGDGGVYRSGNGGGLWEHRNRDLATLEYISVAQHPQYETILIGGTQDNGTHRYTGSPAWIRSAGGDGGFTAIDQASPNRMYHQYVSTSFYRSDAYGNPGSWVLKNTGISGPAEFYCPFELDPSNNNTCYFGGQQLWRSANNADSWAAITNALNGNISAIKVHPTDPNTIYAGTITGHVYLIQKTGATWALADVTTTDITGANLPVNVYISDLAADSAGNIWVSLASILWSETSGEFTNDHVYRRLAGMSTWESRSNGLVQANPINSIVIDPTNSSRLFCGGDVGVFRTEDAGANWTVWDEGLPNVAVFDMAIHNPRRLLRVATHGRSMWERKIDAMSCPMVDLYMRDNIIDSGRIQPVPEGVVHPLDSTMWVGHWQSEDIKVDGPEPGFQTPSAVNEYLGFTNLQHRTTRRNATNRFYVQVHNRGINTATSVQVRAFFAAASGGLPALPADFWSSGKPFAGTPSGTDWTPIGNAISLGNLEPGEPGVAEWDWFVPNSAPQHSCLLAVATCAEDPLSAAGVLNPDTLVANYKQVTLKNLHVDNAVMGTEMPPEGTYTIDLNGNSKEERLTDVHFRWGSLPKETKVFIAFSSGDGKPAVRVKVAELKRAGVIAVQKATQLFPDKVRGSRCETYVTDKKNIYRLYAQRGGVTIIPGIYLPAGGKVKMMLNFILPNKEPGQYHFDVIQYFGKKIAGGSSYKINAAKK